MKIIRRLILLVAIIAFALCIVLLLNFTAPNPTHRRYSSETPLTTGQANGKQIGDDGERILSNDLNLPNNNDPAQLQCLCGNGSNPCKSCLTKLPSLSTYRVPDFVGPNFLAEAKNKQDLLYTGREVDQIHDYVLAALLMNRPLWVYVRVNTDVAPEFTQLVESTGGGVLYYFTVPGYTDPVDKTVQTGAAISVIGLVGAGSLEWWSHRRRKVRVVVVELPSPTPAPDKPVDSTSRKLDHAEDFLAKRKDRLRGQLDNEDVWGDEA